MLAVLNVGRETVNLFFVTARLQVNELHFGLKASPLFFEIFVLKFLFLELTSCQQITRVGKCDVWRRDATRNRRAVGGVAEERYMRCEINRRVDMEDI